MSNANQINWNEVQTKLAAYIVAANKAAEEGETEMTLFMELTHALGLDAGDVEQVEPLFGANWVTVGVQIGKLKLTLAS